jgi:hypothetical protein
MIKTEIEQLKQKNESPNKRGHSFVNIQRGNVLDTSNATEKSRDVSKGKKSTFISTSPIPKKK